MEAAASASIEAGWQAYGSDGEHVGQVVDVGAGYVEVDHGVLFYRALFIPLGAIARVDPQTRRVHLMRRAAELDDLGWDHLAHSRPAPVAAAPGRSEAGSAMGSVAGSGPPAPSGVGTPRVRSSTLSRHTQPDDRPPAAHAEGGRQVGEQELLAVWQLAQAGLARTPRGTDRWAELAAAEWRAQMAYQECVRERLRRQSASAEQHRKAAEAAKKNRQAR